MTFPQAINTSPMELYGRLIDSGKSHDEAFVELQRAIARAELVAKLKAMLTARGVHVPRHDDVKRLAGRCRTYQLISRNEFLEIIHNPKGR